MCWCCVAVVKVLSRDYKPQGMTIKDIQVEMGGMVKLVTSRQGGILEAADDVTEWYTSMACQTN
jgi:hypothetical protein